MSYVEEHGTARVPKDFVAKNGVKLGNWVDGNRQNYKTNKLSADKIKRLENVLKNANKIILDSDAGQGAVPYLPLDQLGKKKQ